MKIAFLAVLVAGCLPPAEPEPDRGDPHDDDNWTVPGGDLIPGCRQDSECGVQVCARDGLCYPAASVRLVVTTWTIDGEVADARKCVGHPDLYIHFAIANGDSFGYAPVPCRNGKFTVDKLPVSYTRVQIGPEGTSDGTSALITSTNAAMIDLR